MAEECDFADGDTDAFCGVCRRDVVVDEKPLAAVASDPFFDAFVFTKVAAASAAQAALKLLIASTRSAVEPGVSVLETSGTMTLKQPRRYVSSSPVVSV